MSKQMMIIGVVVVLVLVGGGFFLANKNSAPAPTDNSQVTAPVEESSDPDASSSDSATSGTIKEFTVTGSPFKFEPATLAVNKGDTVKITFKNTAGMHNLTFDDFNAASKTIQAGTSDTFQFVADKAGSFEYYCSVSNHKAMGMVGTLTVK